jgi:tyrosine-protein phosphatase
LPFAPLPLADTIFSLVFQLVEYGRNLTTLLTAHLAQPGVNPPKTLFPTTEDAGLSEAEWARRRREFDEECEGGDCGMSPEEVQGEARRLDEAMVERRKWRE